MPNQASALKGLSSGEMLLSLHMNASRLAGSIDTAAMITDMQSIYNADAKHRVLPIKIAKLISYCYPYLIFMIATKYKNTIECLSDALQAEQIIDVITDKQVTELRKAMTLYKTQTDDSIIMGETFFSPQQLVELSESCHTTFKSCARSKRIPDKAYKIDGENADITAILSSPTHMIRAFVNNHIFRKEIKQLIKDFKAEYHV